MCGIVGFVNYKKELLSSREIINSMNQTLSNRGPDEEGIYLDKNVALGHKRLIVIDPEGGKQDHQAGERGAGIHRQRGGRSHRGQGKCGNGLCCH